MSYKSIFVVGPTASGKTRFAIDSAIMHKGEIVNCDSVQVFQSVNIGTAKPTRSELNSVKHHLIDQIKKGQSCTAGDYRRLALEVIEDAKKRDLENLYFVGGSGFYFQALEKGMFEAGKVSEELHLKVREEGATPEGLQELFLELKQADPETALKIGANDSYRILRAVELLRAYGEAPSQLKARFKPQLLEGPIIKIGLYVDRDRLRTRVVERTRQMFMSGLIEEVESLLKEGFRNWSPLSSVGYKEVVAYLEGELTLQNAEALIVQNTMQLAKRQMTWFKRDKDIKWFDSESEVGLAHDWLSNKIQSIDAGK